jgi:hypothetical protein
MIGGDTQTVNDSTLTVDGSTWMIGGGTRTISGDPRMVDDSTMMVGARHPNRRR